MARGFIVAIQGRSQVAAQMVEPPELQKHIGTDRGVLQGAAQALAPFPALLGSGQVPRSIPGPPVVARQ
jgi:hypothetical protein